MKLFRLLLLVMAVFTAAAVRAQDCRCISFEQPVVKKDEGIVIFEITNNCSRRVWLYTKGFWMTISASVTDNATASMQYKLTNDEPEYRLFKWNDRKQLVFHVDKLKELQGSLHFSYSNTSNIKAASMLGPKTYLCEKSFTVEPGE
jgi:hypothetical protein